MRQEQKAGGSPISTFTRRCFLSMEGTISHLRFEAAHSYHRLNSLKTHELNEYLYHREGFVTAGFIARRQIRAQEPFAQFLKQAVAIAEQKETDQITEQDLNKNAPIADNLPWNDSVLINVSDMMISYLRRLSNRYLIKQLRTGNHSGSQPGHTARHELLSDKSLKKLLEQAVCTAKHIHPEFITDPVIARWAPLDESESWDKDVSEILTDLLKENSSSGYVGNSKEWQNLLSDSRLSFQRNKLLRISFLLGLDPEEEQKMLLAADCDVISVHNPLDYIKTFCRQNGKEYQWEDIEDLLYKFETGRKGGSDAASESKNNPEHNENDTKFFQDLLDERLQTVPEGKRDPEEDEKNFLQFMQDNADFFTRPRSRINKRYHLFLLKKIEEDDSNEMVQIRSEINAYAHASQAADSAEDILDDLKRLTSGKRYFDSHREQFLYRIIDLISVLFYQNVSSRFSAEKWRAYLMGDVPHKSREDMISDVNMIAESLHFSSDEKTDFKDSCKEYVCGDKSSFRSYSISASETKLEKLDELVRCIFILNQKPAAVTVSDSLGSFLSEIIPSDGIHWKKLKKWEDKAAFKKHFSNLRHKNGRDFLMRSDILFLSAILISLYRKASEDEKEQLLDYAGQDGLRLKIIDVLDTLSEIEEENAVDTYIWSLNRILESFDFWQFYPAFLYDRIALLYLVTAETDS